MTAVIGARESKVLEFDRIRENLAAKTVSPMAGKEALQLTPFVDAELIRTRLGETSEGRLLCMRSGFSPPGVIDPEPLVERAEKGSQLNGEELAAIKDFIAAIQRWQSYFKDEEQPQLYPLMAGLVGRTEPLPGLFSALKRSVDADGNILDSASPELSSLRRRQRALQDRVREKLDDYLRNTNFRRYLQEALVTIRSGRYVLPVKQEYRQNVDGVVHDQSSSGATLFIEPMPVVQMQNQLTALQREEVREIDRILAALTAAVADEAAPVSTNRHLYGRLDLIVAAGRLSLEQRASAPQFITAGEEKLEMVEARHPLLPGEAVPLNVKLGGSILTLVITGPNTGGKTVSLKTIGLLTVMAQCGLHIPASPETRLSVFKMIRADIGDEQSIAQSLSTFSGHMRNIITIVKEASAGSLVLLDELGAGTDPSEGAALAMALLHELTESGAITVATTHINELKLYAQAEEKLQNAAMEFDPQTLSPTYRLLQGVPGQSNALAVAAKLGLDQPVLERAAGYLHRSHDQVESIIASLVEDQQKYHRDSRQASLDRSRAERIIEELEQERDEVRSRREDILSQAREEARNMLRRAKTGIDEMIRELKTIKAAGGEQVNARAEAVRRDLHTLKKELAAGDGIEDEPERQPDPADLKPGLTVFIPSLQQNGELVSVEGDEALVQAGLIRVHLPLADLRLARKEKDRKKTASPKSGSLSGGGFTVQKDPVVSSSVDLRGMTIDEARPVVEKLLDNAVWAGLGRVDIIHGKGTGKLKEGLRAYLKGHSFVQTIRPGGQGEGGDGVTVVELKK